MYAYRYLKRGFSTLNLLQNDAIDGHSEADINACVDPRADAEFAETRRCYRPALKRVVHLQRRVVACRRCQ